MIRIDFIELEGNPAGRAFCVAFRGSVHRNGDSFRCRESWHLGAEARDGAVDDRRSDAFRI